MVKKFKIYTAMCMFLFMVLSFWGPSVFAATIGQRLTAPEAGWIRFDDLNPAFQYNGIWREGPPSASSVTSPYLGREHWVTPLDTNAANTSIDFKFVGTSLRIIVSQAYTAPANIGVTIDGTNYSYNPYKDGLEYQDLAFEKTGLPYEVHTIHVQPSANGVWSWDAIDIDDTGYLINSNLAAPTNLTATAGNAIVDLNWTAVAGASGYTVKRAANAGGPYETIASSVTDATYTDTSVTGDATYYYVVTAFDSNGESAPSNEASATLTATSTRAILAITLNNGLEKEFDLSMDEVNSFISWYEEKAAGAGPAFYAIDKHDNNKGPFKNRKTYVIFDKILTFDVNEYSPF